ncbi:patatin-like phospholipase family protein [Vreelandella rituensis]|uniref:Patatin n=1 Tax=Vreelandella rituensis TaxID=2282306 RepID=A0A368TZT8_9GAMM|nr:patatin-like phospholipase family protein [Halomonas rituensis]RCV90340.1 patatin [Halomonas rituensis]
MDKLMAPEKGNKVALVLGSGGARGYAHIGVIEVLEERGYEIISVAGCSMGALIGGIYASGNLPAYRDWVCGLDYFDVLKLVDVTWNPMGAMRASKIMNKLESLVGDVLIEDLPIPLTTVATDLVRQREVWFQRGPLLRAIRASIAVPGVITPVHLGDQVLVDGGLLNPLPMMPVEAAHAADFVVAVNVTAHTPQPVMFEDLLPDTDFPDSEAELEKMHPVEGWMNDAREATKRLWEGLGGSDGGVVDKEETPEDRSKREWSKLAMIFESFDVTQAALAKYKIASYSPDMLIEIPKTVCGAYEFHRANELIRLGRHLTEQGLSRFIPKVKVTS